MASESARLLRWARLCGVVATVALLAMLAAPGSSDAANKCFGHTPTIVGGPGNNHLDGTPGTDVIASGGGNDVVDSHEGDDFICGGSGNDELHGGDQGDKIAGEGGRDFLDGRRGDDNVLLGGRGRDRLLGDSLLKGGSSVPV